MEYGEFGRYYEAMLPGLRNLKGKLDAQIEDILSNFPHIDRYQCRVKSVDSAYKKFKEKYKDADEPFLEFEDLVAARVIVFFISDVSKVRDVILENFEPIERSERRPKLDDQFGYESEHLVLAVPPNLKPSSGSEFCPNTFEMQVRTILMHAYAEPQHDILYKGEATVPKNIKRRLAWIAASCWGADREYEELRRWSDSGEDGSVINHLDGDHN